MPNITEFDAGSLRLQPSQSGVEADVRAAYRGGSLFSRAAMETERAYDAAGRAIGTGVAAAGEAAIQYEDHREISAGTVQAAQLLFDKDQEWNDLVKTADPNDPRVAAKFRDQSLEPALEDFQSQFHTQHSQQWALEYTNKIRQHMFEKTAADQSTLAGIAAHDNAIQAGNTFAAAAYKDPSSLGIAIDGFTHSLEGLTGSSPTMTPAKAAEIRETVGYDGTRQIVQAAVHGAIENGGDWHSIADNPKYAPYINAAEIQQFARQEKFYQKGLEVESKRKLLLDKEIATQDMHKAVNDSWSKNVNIDPTGKVTIDPQFVRDMVKLPTEHANAPGAAETAHTYINWIESQQKAAATPHDDPASVDALLKTISNPDVSASDAKMAILKADTAAPMTARTRENMIQLATDMRNLNDPLLARDLEAAKHLVMPFGEKLAPDPAAYAKFYYDFIHNQYMPAKMAGTLPPNALDMSDPKSMISQAITKATGGPAVVLPAAVTANGGVGAVQAKPKAAAPPAKGDVRMYQGVQYEFQGGDPRDKNNWKPAS